VKAQEAVDGRRAQVMELLDGSEVQPFFGELECDDAQITICCASPIRMPLRCVWGL